MECNRDEALRAKEIAEKKLLSQDYQGALKFLQKALQIFPALENTSQITAVVDVHVAALAKINGSEMDWYGILQVDPGAEESVIKKQYKKLALLLHPDKNKYAGAEAAFKLIGEALQVLSDKQQRLLYDARRKPAARRAFATQGSQSRQASNQAFVNRQVPTSLTFMTVCPACHTRYQYYRVYENQNLLCHQCRVPFIAREYVPANGAYNAHGWQRFSQPPTGFSTNSFQTFASTTNFTSGMTFMNDTAHGGPWSNGVNGAAAPSSVHVNQVPTDRAQMEQSAQELKRKRKDEEREMRRMEKERQKKARADQKALERELLRKRREVEKLSGKDKKRHLKKHSSDSSDSDTDSDSDEDISEEEVLNHRPDSQSAPRRSSRPRRNVTYKVDVSDDEDVSPGNGETPSAKKDSQKVTESADVQTNKTPDRVSDSAKARLAELVKLKIRVNLAKSMVNKDEEKIDSIKPKPNVVDLTSDDGQVQLDNKDQKIEPGSNAKVKLTSGSFCTEDKHKMAEKGEVDEMSGSDANIHNQAGTKTERKEELEEEKEGEGEEEEEEDEETEEEEEEEAEKYVVPDPEFHDFDAHRQEKDIKAGQMWASYDDIDGLPRFYFRVKEVLSLDPFRVSISWLELQNMTADQYALKKLGFWPTCGTGFKSKGGQVLDSLNMFSHILNWEKGPKGQVMIYPKKGDIWALYRNWKPGLHVEEKSLLQEYDMVEVLSDFDKQEGVLVVHLEKLQDHKTLFKRTNVQLEIRAFELCKFSYHVPAYLLRVEESPLKEECCWELDPASVSLEDVLPGSGDSKPV